MTSERSVRSVGETSDPGIRAVVEKMGIMENGRLPTKYAGDPTIFGRRKGGDRVLSKEEIDRIAEEILAGFQAGKEERTSAPKTKRNSGPPESLM